VLFSASLLSFFTAKKKVGHRKSVPFRQYAPRLRVALLRVVVAAILFVWAGRRVLRVLVVHFVFLLES